MSKLIVFKYKNKVLSESEFEQFLLSSELDENKEVGNNSIFDFTKYKKEYSLIGQYFTGLEKELRSAILVDYLHNYINKNDRKIVYETILAKLKNVKLKREKLELLDEITNVFEPEYLFKSFYKFHIPNRTNKYINKIWEKYQNNSYIGFKIIYRKYIDENYKDQKLWFETTQKNEPITIPDHKIPIKSGEDGKMEFKNGNWILVPKK